MPKFHSKKTVLKKITIPLLNPRWTFGLILVFLIGCGALLRFSDLSAPLLDFHPTRQLFGAIKARGIYYQSLKMTTPEDASRKDLAVRQYEGEAIIEPPIMEQVSATLYATFGEQTAIPRAISASFWMLGGLFLFLLSKNLTGSLPAATCALAFYLLTPYSISASRAFQPDPLMVLLLLIFWWSIENWSRHEAIAFGRTPYAPTGQNTVKKSGSLWVWAVIAGISGGLAIFVKFPAVFFVIGAALGAIFGQIGLLKSLKLPRTWVIIVLGILPPVTWLLYGTFMGGFLGQQFSARFYPEMWISPFFYLRWFLKLENVTSIIWIALALLGWLQFSSKPAKIFLAGLWSAYIIFGLTFAHHISSHDYYSVPFLPIAALGLAQLSVVTFVPVFGIRSSQPVKHDRPGLKGSFQLVALIILLSTILLISIDQYIQRRTNDYRPQAALWAQIGNAIGHQPGVLALTTDYGYPLAYYGWQNSTPWPASVDISNYKNTFSRLAANKDYFLITDFDEYERQAELQQQLKTHYPILAQARGYIVFDLAHPLK